MSYNPLTPPHSNRLLACLCNGKTKKILFYLGLKILIFGLIFHHGSGNAKKPIKYSFVGERTKIFEATANESCLLPNPSLFSLHSSSLPRCDHSIGDWLWVNVNGDVLPREGREDAYCKKRRNREEDWTKLRFGERLHDIMEVRCSHRGEKWQNFLWRLTKNENLEKELRDTEEDKENLLIFELSSIGKDEIRQQFRSTISWLKNKRPFTEFKHMHATSDNYYIDGMFRESVPSGRFSKDSHATLIIDREHRRNLSQFAHHYGYFHYPTSSSCLHSDDQPSKSLSVLSSFLYSYPLLPHFASVHLSVSSTTDTTAMDVELSSWLDQNRHLLERTTIVVTAGGNPLRDSSTSHKDLLDARLPFLAVSPFPQGENPRRHSLSSSLISSSDFFSSDLLEANYRSRNCSEAGIGEEYCMCVERRAALTSPSGIQEVIEIVDSIITWINEKTLKYRFRCEVLTGDEIIDATKLSISPSALRLPIDGKMDRYFVDEEFTQFTIRFRTIPGKKLFSATVIYFSSQRLVEIDEESLRLISEEENGDCSRAFPSVAHFCSCKSFGMSFFRHFLG
ncbi:hypothetical protein PMAYCL1PPCAC_23387 [Pristionchus mayeri]|uniref:Uncharacterized protein n=1 Tax=Pristionchus mayeri TaxID=1317129 RepID=A0AAN5CZ58_9BILA|nr:hypothetical protein PMAYCL1PPCAC_23387 [Pristionchus mayeri]